MSNLLENNQKMKAWNTLKSFLQTNKINYSLSKLSYVELRNKNFSRFENDFSICLYWNDYLFLKKKYPSFFYDNEIEKINNVMPYFLENLAKININIIFKSSFKMLEKEKILCLINKNSLFNYKLKKAEKKFNLYIKKNTIYEIVKSLYAEQNNFYLVVSNNFFYSWSSINLMWGDITKIKYKDMEFDCFNKIIEQ